MGLEQQLTAFRAEFARTAPTGRTALYEAKIEELRGCFALDKAARRGGAAPDFTLRNAYGKPVNLFGLLQLGPGIVTFYRGGWCPYCNIQLRACQAALPEFTGAPLVAISPQLPDGSLSTAQTNALSFDVLSDAGNKVADRFGLVYSLPEELRAALRANNKALSGINGDDS